MTAAGQRRSGSPLNQEAERLARRYTHMPATQWPATATPITISAIMIVMRKEYSIRPVGRKNLMQQVKQPADKHDGDPQALVLR